jgi:hypothetical protein
VSGEIEAYVDAAAQLNGLALGEASRTAVAANLSGLFRMAELFAGLDLEPGLDPAPVYIPPEATP